MNVAKVQLNNLDFEGLDKEKINLNCDGFSEEVGFQDIIATMLGVQLDVFSANGVQDGMIAEITNGVDTDVGQMIKTESNLNTVDNKSISESEMLSLLPMNQSILKVAQEMIRQSTNEQGIVNFNKMQNFENVLVDENLELPSQFNKAEVIENLKLFFNSMQSELNVQEVIETTQPEVVEFTLKSYQNLQRIQFISEETKETVDVKIMTQGSKEPEEVLNQIKVQTHPGNQKSLHAEKENHGMTVNSRPVELPNEKKISNSNHVPNEIRVNETSQPEAISTNEKPMIISNDKEIVDTMIENIRETNLEGVSKMKVFLKPKELGHVEIELNFKNGKIEGLIKVANNQIKSQIEQIITPVKAILQNENLEISDFKVSVFQEFNQQQFSNHRENQYVRMADEMEDFEYSEMKLFETHNHHSQSKLNLLA